MNSPNLPSGWTVEEEYVPYDQIYGEPPESSDAGRILFYGLRDEDRGHRLYSIPAHTPVADVVRAFEVGSHGAQSYGFDAEATIEIVAEKAAQLVALAPCRVIFADRAGLKLKFLRPIQNEDLDQIALLFPEDEGFQSGAELYFNEWLPDRHMFQKVKDENLFHFWWD